MVSVWRLLWDGHIYKNASVHIVMLYQLFWHFYSFSCRSFLSPPPPPPLSFYGRLVIIPTVFSCWCGIGSKLVLKYIHTQRSDCSNWVNKITNLFWFFFLQGKTKEPWLVVDICRAAYSTVSGLNCKMMFLPSGWLAILIISDSRLNSKCFWPSA